MRRIIAVILSVFTLLSAAPAVAEQFGDVYYNVPSGWQKVEEGGFAILASPLDRNGKPKAAIFITQGEDYSGSFRKWFYNTVVQGESNETSISRSGTNRIQAKGNYEAFTMDTITRDAQGTQLHRKYIAANPGGRAQLFVYITYSEKAQKRYFPQLQEFLESVQYAQLGGGNAFSGNEGGLPWLNGGGNDDGGSFTPPPPVQNNGDCRPRYRQQCNYIGAGAYQTYSCQQVPYTPPGCN